MIDILKNIPPEVSNFFSIIGTIVGIILSIVTIICANNIPKAITQYRINNDMKENLKNINSSIKRMVDSLQNTVPTKEEFIVLFDNVDSMLFEYGKYMERRFQKKSKKLHNEYIKMTEKFKDEDVLNKVETVRLLNKYTQLLNLIKVDVGSVDVDDEKEQ